MRITNKSRLLARLGVCLTLTLALLGFEAMAESFQENQVRAGLTLNLVRFSTWPAASNPAADRNLKLCLLGDATLEETFSTLNGKSIADKVLQVSYLKHLNGLASCQIIYVSGLDKEKLAVVLREVGTLPILTIGEDINFLTLGGIASFIYTEGKITIAINIKALEKSKLYISVRVISLATIIQ